MATISFRVEPEHSAKLKQMARQTGLNTSEILRHLVTLADVAPVTTYKPTIKNTSTPADGVPVSNVGSGIGQDTGQISN